MIVEGIVTTLNPAGDANIAPMGPITTPSFERLTLRPFQTSTTYQNLKRTGAGVFHVTDDVELLARAAVGELTSTPRLTPAPEGAGVILADACRWYAFRVEELDDAAERTRIECRVFASGVQREFLGFNRAKHAVLEAAILATRLHLIPRSEVLSEIERLAVIVDKTAGPQEQAAFAFLREYIAAHPA